MPWRPIHRNIHVIHIVQCTCKDTYKIGAGLGEFSWRNETFYDFFCGEIRRKNFHFETWNKKRDLCQEIWNSCESWDEMTSSDPGPPPDTKAGRRQWWKDRDRNKKKVVCCLLFILLLPSSMSCHAVWKEIKMQIFKS